MKRNIAICVVLSIITCGVYSIFWIYALTKDVGYLSKIKTMKPSIIIWLFCLMMLGYIVYFTQMQALVNATIHNAKSIADGLSMTYYILIGLGAALYIYLIYWAYKVGKLMHQAKLNRQMPSSEYTVAYVLLSVVGLGVIVYALVQAEVNTMALVPEVA